MAAAEDSSAAETLEKDVAPLVRSGRSHLWDHCPHTDTGSHRPPQIPWGLASRTGPGRRARGLRNESDLNQIRFHSSAGNHSAATAANYVRDCIPCMLVALLRRLMEPGLRAPEIPRHTFPKLIHAAQRKLCVGVAALRGLSIPFGGLGKVLCCANSVVETSRSFRLGLTISRRRGS